MSAKHSIAARAEAAALGCAFLDLTAAHELVSELTPEAFQTESLRLIFEAVADLLGAGAVPDVITVHQWVKSHGHTVDASLIARVADHSTAANLKHYMGQVKTAWARRQVAAHGDQMQRVAKDEKLGAAELLEQAQSGAYALHSDGGGEKILSNRELMQQALKRHDAPPGPPGIPCGFASLDAYLGGLRAGNLIILGATPGTGKTSLANNIAAHVARSHPVGIFNLEMSEAQAATRAIASEARIDSRKIDFRNLDMMELAAFTKAANTIASLPIYSDFTAGMSIGRAMARAREMALRYGIKLLVVDYLQLMKGDRKKGDSRADEIGTISRGLKEIAKNLGITVIALSQLNREVDKRKDNRPQMSDLRESGSIEQDADAVLFLWRRNPQILEQVVAIIEKNRNGPVIDLPLIWNAPHLLFKDAPR